MGQQTNGGGKKPKFTLPVMIAEIVVLLAATGILCLVVFVTGKVERTNIDKSSIIINDGVVVAKENQEASDTADATDPASTGYRNIALFGVDALDGSLGKGSRSDTIIIASINQDTKEIKLISVYRDTYLNLSNDSYNKCNGAYGRGGPEMAINMLNLNLDLDITDYVTVGFEALADAVDALGGVEMNITDAEIKHLNNYQLTMAESFGTSYTPVTKSGLQNLNGLQATAYCRIRYTAGDDFRRAERQRDVLSAMMEKAQSASLASLTEAATAILPSVNTSLTLNELVAALGDAADYKIVESDGFPFEQYRVSANIGSKGSCVVPTSLVDNVTMLHAILFDDEDYTPSAEVKQISAQIASQTKDYID